MSDESNFKFPLRRVVVIDESEERGTIIARAQYAHSENAYLVRYPNKLGVAVEQWWGESALSEF